MPQVVNGCGTWYYGKKNVQQYQGVCRACNRITTLTSYDTRLFVVVFFIPVVPLGRKRIIEECAACRSHHAMPLGDWERAQRRAQEAIEAYRRSPTDPTLADEAVGACLGYRMAPAFAELAPEIERYLASDAKTLCLLAAAHDLFGRLRESERLLLAALQVQDDYETRELLADCLLRQDRPNEAEPYLWHIVEEGIPDRVNLLYQLAQGYQIRGEHDKALTVFQHCEAVNPGIAEDKVFLRLRDASASHQGTRVAVKPAAVAAQVKRGAAYRRFTKAAPVVLALAALAYAALAWIQGSRREVCLVNGLERSYVALLNGESHALPPLSVTKVRLGEGDVTVQISDAPATIGPETVTIRTPFLTRPFSNETFVINPDRTAILQRTRVHYVPRDRGGPAPLPDESYFAGSTLHHFTGLDHVFEDMPASIKMDSHAASVSKEGLYLAGQDAEAASPYLLLGLKDELGPEAVVQIARRHLLLEPQQTRYLSILLHTGKPAEVAEFLRPGLERRPVEIIWHRTYQNAMTQAQLDKEVEREYEAMLTREPQNKDLVYLTGRAALNVDRCLSLYRQAAEGDAPCPYAFYSLCFYHLSSGEFREAAQYAERTLKLLPDGEPGMKLFCRQALLANGQYDRVRELIRQQQAGPIMSVLDAYQEEACVLAMQGRQDEAGKAIARLQERLQGYNPESVARYVHRVEAQLAYLKGDTAAFVAALRTSDEPSERLIAHLAAGELLEAENAVSQVEPEEETQLLLYIAAVARNQPEMAERHLKAAADLLDKGDFEDRAFASALKGEASMSLAELLRAVRRPPREKAVLLTALGLRNPAARQACFELARKLNFDKRFPHLLIRQVTESRPAN